MRWIELQRFGQCTFGAIIKYQDKLYLFIDVSPNGGGEVIDLNDAYHYVHTIINLDDTSHLFMLDLNLHDYVSGISSQAYLRLAVELANNVDKESS